MHGAIFLLINWIPSSRVSGSGRSGCFPEETKYIAQGCVSLIALLNKGWHSETSLNEMKGKDELEHSIWENKARIPNGQRNSRP
jgi:hypothetical protein|uniref:Uncharacterized protein n=1 Tax=Picea glauca TaxID=3330 RepID=A0A117NFW0_PICGL|nr:hypothetical protein ABT39_MTgene2369 [Picea glauca]QHR92252.1 hypothetical protein Q903MT_gene6291 [Picea sitchensis]